MLAPATPALAQDELHFCPNRPSLGASACVTDPGHVQVEISVLDWQRDDRSDSREDQLLAADLLARIGVSKSTEVQLEWTTVGRVRERDKATGTIASAARVGDLRLAVRQNLRNPDGHGLSFGVEPFVMLPVGRKPVGGGDWGAGAMIPVTYDLTDALNLAFTGQVAGLADEDGNGRHLNYSGIVGLGYELSKKVTLVSEISVERDDDPEGGETHLVAAESIAWQPYQHVQVDLLAAVGLNRETPDLRLALGGAFLF